MKFFNLRFIEECVACDVDTVFRLADSGQEIVIYGPFRKFYFGKIMFQKISHSADSLHAAAKMLFQFICRSQYEIPDACDTPLYTIRDESVDEEKQKTLTSYTNNSGDYITGADFFALITDNNAITIPYHYLHQIVPASWQLIDEKQYKTNPLSDNEWNGFLNRAEKFKIKFS